VFLEEGRGSRWRVGLDPLLGDGGLRFDDEDAPAITEQGSLVQA